MPMVYAGATRENSSIYITIVNGAKKSSFNQKLPVKASSTDSLISFLRTYEKTKKESIRGMALSSDLFAEIYNKIWLDLDISPFEYKNGKLSGKNFSAKAAEYAKSQFEKDHSYKAKVGKNNKVITPPLIKLEDYAAITPPERMAEMMDLVKATKDKKVAFISATPQGGGVALMRHSQIRLAKLLGLDWSWHVLKDDLAIFDITKRKFHNVLQNVADDSVRLTKDEKEAFKKWSAKNAEILKPVFEENDIIVIDDPQPSGLIPYIRKSHPDKPIIYRSHIHLFAALADKPGSSQHTTWSFIWSFAKHADFFISHPVPGFVPKVVDKKKLIYMPATTDPLDGLNKELSDTRKDFYMRIVNKILADTGQTEIDHTRPFITQIARFDPSKGILDLLESYRLLRAKSDHNAQLVITGNSSIDDPDGKPIYQMVMNRLENADYKNYKDDVKVIRLPHFDQLLDTVLRESIICLQLSHREGFEVKVTEALMKGKPVITYKTGGIPLQYKDGKEGFSITTGNTKKVAEKIDLLLSDINLYNKMSRDALNMDFTDVSTVGNAIHWMEVFKKYS